MKTEIEINNFTITVEDIEGKVQIKAEINDEVIEELSLDPTEHEGGEDEEEIKAFGDEDSEEDDSEDEEEMEEDDSDEDEDEEEEEMMGESIKSFDEMFSPKKKSKKTKKK